MSTENKSLPRLTPKKITGMFSVFLWVGIHVGIWVSCTATTITTKPIYFNDHLLFAAA